ncbi:MAG: KdsC family phosphatase [Candidatus Aminicenantales bacterium]
MTSTATDRARKISLILMDVDGTLTDGTLIVTSEGEELKTYHVRDGLGILLARLAGLDLGIITGKTSKGLEKRAERLRITELHQGALDKPRVLREILERRGLPPEQVAYIGDDVGDLAVMKTVGLAGAVADAHPEVREHCQFISGFAGGHGAVREFIEFILKAQGKWDAAAGRVHDLRGPAI